MTYYEAMRRRREAEDALRKNTEEAKRKVKEIIEHPETVVLAKEQNARPWEYVENLFPRIAPTIERTKVLKNENTAFCNNLGIPPEAGGLFFIHASTILLCWNKEKFKDDVVICHEMLHYASQLMGGNMISREAEEDFAYSKSIKYLTLQGYSDKWISEEYMLPYFWGLVWNDPKRKLSKDDARIEALKLCQSMIDAELKGPDFKNEVSEPDRFDVI